VLLERLDLLLALKRAESTTATETKMKGGRKLKMALPPEAMETVST
jgi:hypothetical protein